MGNKLTTKQFAAKLEITAPRVRQMILARELPAEKFGRDWLIDETLVDIVKNRPETRGRKPYKKAA